MARRTIGHRKGSAISRPIAPSTRDQMVGGTIPVLVVVLGQAPPDTSSRALSPSPSLLDVDEILVSVTSFRSRGSASPLELAPCVLLIFDLQLSSMLIVSRHDFKPS